VAESALRRRHLRDAATICDAVLYVVPTLSLRCELDAGHLDHGVKHKSGCTHWGTPIKPGAGSENTDG
jgi:hypothetical protein